MYCSVEQLVRLQLCMLCAIRISYICAYIVYIVRYYILYHKVEDETIGEITTVSGGQPRDG